MANTTLPNWRDIQGLVLSAYPHLDAAEYVPLRIDDPDTTRGWLRWIASHVTTAFEPPYAATEEFTGAFGPRVKLNVNIAISYTGLATLWKISDVDRDKLPFPFVEGIAGTSHRSRILGDTGDSAPAKWDWGGSDRPVDLLLMVFARDARSLHHAVDRALDSSGTTRLLNVPLEALSLVDAESREHFGFVDGRSQPILTGTADAERFSESIHLTELGEFVLGYPNCDQVVAPPLTLDGFDFGKNGSYLVLRQLAQDVPKFRKFMFENSADESGAIELASKVVGRCPDGTPLVPGGRSHDNEFDYSGDPHGYGCPVGAHIRRSNPRGSLSKHRLVREKVNGHRLLRRGRSYGPKWKNDPNDTTDRGLVFLALNANIERQFEFINQNWINGTSFSGLPEESDPLIGTHPEDSLFTVSAEPSRRRVKGLEDFVTVKGGEYFFLPGIEALKRLAGAV